jgi:hypothetical protein
MPMRRSKSPTSNVLQNPAQEQGQQRKLMSVFCGELAISVPNFRTYTVENIARLEETLVFAFGAKPSNGWNSATDSQSQMHFAAACSPQEGCAS